MVEDENDGCHGQMGDAAGKICSEDHFYQTDVPAAADCLYLRHHDLMNGAADKCRICSDYHPHCDQKGADVIEEYGCPRDHHDQMNGAAG